jgi:hypothetical protein
VTLKYQGGGVYFLGNTFRPPCVLELSENADLPSDSQTSDLLAACKAVRKLKVVMDSTTVGFSKKWETIGGRCIIQKPGGGITMTSGQCGKETTVTAQPR